MEVKSLKWRKGIKGLKEWVLDALFPRFCLGCKQEGSVFCITCAETFDPIRPHVGCPFCDIPGSNATCAACRPSRALDGLTTLFMYGNPAVRGAITGYKFSGDAAYADVLAHWLRTRISMTDFPTVDVVIAIPLHPSRLRSRGFNQADLIAREVAAALSAGGGSASGGGCPVISPLARTRKTSPQSSLAHAERKADGLAGAFSCASPVPERILLCDDVFTSGATMDAAAAALKQAGAKEVWGFAVAKG